MKSIMFFLKYFISRNIENIASILIFIYISNNINKNGFSKCNYTKF